VTGPVRGPELGGRPGSGEPRGRGRRPGGPDTRGQILTAARRSFAEKGFGRTTIRAVAGDADVDPALVHHYFGTKDDLFMAALELPVDPRVLLEPMVRSGPDGAGERLVRTLVGVWDDPDNQRGLVGLLRSVLGPDGGRLLGEGFVPVVLGPLGTGLGLDRPDVRMPLVASQVLGLLMCRYLLELEPLASMDAEALVETYGPTVQRYLTGPLPT
jgi:AcrR family transcriptional regulator